MDKQAKKLAKRIREEMESRDWTQTQLAEACGLSRAHINNLLSAKNSPTLRLCEKVASALELSLSELLAEPSEESDDDVLSSFFRYWEEARRRSRGNPEAHEFFEAFDKLVKLYEKKIRE